MSTLLTFTLLIWQTELTFISQLLITLFRLGDITNENSEIMISLLTNCRSN